MIEKTIEVVDGRCGVVAGVGSNNTQKTIQLSQAAHELGADALLVITPYYNKPTQQGLYAHFSAVSDAVPDSQIMLYNVPARTGVSLTVETIAQLADVENIVALKEPPATWHSPARITAACGDLSTSIWRRCNRTPHVGRRRTGVVSVTSNLPERMVELWNAFERDRAEDAGFISNSWHSSTDSSSKPIPRPLRPSSHSTQVSAPKR